MGKKHEITCKKCGYKFIHEDLGKLGQTVGGLFLAPFTFGLSLAAPLLPIDTVLRPEFCKECRPTDAKGM